MITTTDTYIIEESAKVQYAALDILCVPTVLDADGIVNIDVRTITDTGQVLASILISFTNAEIEAFTPSGTSDLEKFYNQCEQAVKGYLEGLGGNDGLTFTIT